MTSIAFLYKVEYTGVEAPSIDICSGYTAASYQFFGEFKEKYKLYAVAVNFDVEIEENITLKERLMSLDVYDSIINIPQITKEEFYDRTRQ